MDSSLALLIVHILAAFVFAHIFCNAPDTLQKFILALFALTSLTLVGVYAAEVADNPLPGLVKMISYKVEHLAVLLYAFRILYVERLSCKNSYNHYPPSPVL